MSEGIRKAIQEGKTILGLEFGSTRIKAVLVDETYQPVAMGTWDWENSLVDNIWTYSQEDIWEGLRGCYKSLAEDVRTKYGVELTKLAAMGFSGMMHGYMPFHEMEYRSSVPGDSERRGACEGDRVSYDTGRLHTLAADRRG